MTDREHVDCSRRIRVAALYVDPKGCYAGLDDVDLWDEARDARKYDGPWPVVAHPPCSRWCQLAAVVEARYGYKRGEDGGCFAAALAAVRKWGGVLEHPAYTLAWPKYGLPRPDRQGGWQATICGGWVCHVEQVRYGHRARKGTWLYACGMTPPALRWGASQYSGVDWRHGDPERPRSTAASAKRADAVVSWCRNHGMENDERPRIGKKEASATPQEFRDVLLEIARKAHAHD